MSTIRKYLSRRNQQHTTLRQTRNPHTSTHRHALGVHTPPPISLSIR